MIGKLTPQERMRLAQHCNKRAKDPNLSPKQRSEARGHAWNLVQINMAEAKRKKPD